MYWGKSTMSDYTQMSPYYDLIMTSGYYDYDAIVDELISHDDARRILEIGTGTGLILERLAARSTEAEIVGVDLTPAMLEIAARRLKQFPQVRVHLQNIITLSLDRQFDLAFSYGGVWYFVPDDDGTGLSMISHLHSQQDNLEGFRHVAAQLPPGAVLLLGIQAPHTNYSRPVDNGMEYAQQISPLPDGFRKHYSLTDQGQVVMEQITDYRVYPLAEAIRLLEKCGFEYVDRRGPGTGLFVEFSKR
jgi:SAM-dependent methyltransferase